MNVYFGLCRQGHSSKFAFGMGFFVILGACISQSSCDSTQNKAFHVTNVVSKCIILKGFPADESIVVALPKSQDIYGFFARRNRPGCINYMYSFLMSI